MIWIYFCVILTIIKIMYQHKNVGRLRELSNLCLSWCLQVTLGAPPKFMNKFNSQRDSKQKSFSYRESLNHVFVHIATMEPTVLFHVCLLIGRNYTSILKYEMKLFRGHFASMEQPVTSHITQLLSLKAHLCQ